MGLLVDHAGDKGERRQRLSSSYSLFPRSTLYAGQMMPGLEWIVDDIRVGRHHVFSGVTITLIGRYVPTYRENSYHPTETTH